jgi:hypothetical protein
VRARLVLGALSIVALALLTASVCDPVPQPQVDPNTGFADLSSSFTTGADGTATVGGVEVVGSTTAPGDVEVVVNQAGDGSCNARIDSFSFSDANLEIVMLCECDLSNLEALPAGATLQSAQIANFSASGLQEFYSTWGATEGSFDVAQSSGDMQVSVDATVRCEEPNTANVDEGTIPIGLLALHTPLSTSGFTSVKCTLGVNFVCHATQIGHSIGTASVFGETIGASDVDSCENNPDCGPGEACIDEGVEIGLCRPPQAGDRCTFETQCAGNGQSGLRCVEVAPDVGECHDGSAGDPCEVDQDCASGSCAEGVSTCE